ncbi:MAG: SLC13 family permease [Christensenellales bacterium]|jgi:arsenical pump membrane protein
MVSVLVISLMSSAGMIAAALFKPKIKIGHAEAGTYWMVTLLGAVILLAFGFIGIEEVFSGLTADSAINPLKILALFLAMTLMSIFLDETGFFRYLAAAVLKKAGTGQFRLFTAFFITVSVLTAFTSNDIIILTFTPFICYFTKNAKINPIPYLVSEFVAANTSSMLLIIGNPTNIYLATASGIGFFDYLKVMALPTLFAVVAAYAVMFLLFGKKLKEPITGIAEEIKIADKPLLAVGLIFLSAATVLLAVSAYINLEMWLVAVVSAALLGMVALIMSAARRKKPAELAHALTRAPWELVPFVVSMFVIVLTFEKYGVTAIMASFLGQKFPAFAYGGASALSANLINNIPMSVLFSSVVKSLPVSVMSEAVYAVIIGSNIGAYLTPVGALAGIMWLQIVKTNGIEFSFLKFVKYGLIIAVPALAAALLGLLISLM